MFVEQLAEDNKENFPFILLGNKCDKENEIKINIDDITYFSQNNNNMPYFETSAKDNINVDIAFNKACELMHKKLLEEEENLDEPKYLRISHKIEKKECC